MKALTLSVALASTAALAGCSSLLGGGGREPTTIYAPQVQVDTDAAWPSIPWTIVVANPSAPRVIDSSRIAVRPTPDELQVYHGAAWAQSGTDMLQNAVVRALEDSGRTAGAGTTESGIRGTFKLVMDVRQFEADYAGGDMPSATIVLNAKLVQSYDQSVTASRTFKVVQPARGTAVDQVVPAFDQALSQVTSQIVGWALDSAKAHPPIDPTLPKNTPATSG